MASELDLPPHRLDRLPVLLLGGLNLVRTLGLAGIPAIVGSNNRNDPVFASRYCVGRCVLPPLDHGEAVVDCLVRIGDRLSLTYGRRVPLMYGSDEYLELIIRHRERLQRYFRFLVSDTPLAEGLLEKDHFQALAKARGLPVPRELDWDALAATPQAVLVKPRSKVDWYNSPMRDRIFDGDGKARVFESGFQAAADPAVALHRDQLAFQEYIPGGDAAHWSFHGLADESGVVLESFVGHKIRTYPPGSGESAFIEMDDDGELSALGCRIAAALPLKGVFKMDFKKDARDGRWYLLEVNARFTLWHYLGAANGLNLMRTTYEYLLDGTRPPHPADYREDYRWLLLGLDFKAFRVLHARGELEAIEWLASILFSRNIYGWFAWNDPMPWVRFWTNRVKRRVPGAMNLIAVLFRQWRSTAS